MYYRQQCDDAKLRRELENERYERQRLEDQLRQEREAAAERSSRSRRERLASYTHDRRTAATWPEALRKQAALFAAEAYQDDVGDDVGAYFIRGKAACERALALWAEEEQKIAEQVAQLQRQIDQLRDGVRVAVADRLDADMPDNEGIAATLRETPETEEDLSEWLNW